MEDHRIMYRDGGGAVGEHIEQQSDRPCGVRHNLRGRASGVGAEGIRNETNWVVRKTKRNVYIFNVIHLISPNVMTKTKHSKRQRATKCRLKTGGKY